MLILYADGGCWPNPGPAAFGVVAEVDGRVVWAFSAAIGEATNNVAEWRAAIAALEYASQATHDTVELRMDSQLVIQQLNGRWRVKQPHLKPLAVQAAALVQTFRDRDVRLLMRWVPREQNTLADCLAEVRPS
jgi:probable phosphoglycerate mutase